LSMEDYTKPLSSNRLVGCEKSSQSLAGIEKLL